MLISVKMNNCLIFNSETEFSMRANMHYKHFLNNVYKVKKLNILKSAIVIGPNNAGKTNFVRVMFMVKQIMLNQNAQIQKNLFTASQESMLEVSFLENNKEYLFVVKYDSSKMEYVYERFAIVTRDEHNNAKEETLLLRDIENNKYECKDENLIPAMKVAARNNILIHLIDSSSFKTFAIIRNVILSFGSKIDIVDMNNIPVKKTIDLLKLDDATSKKIVNFILNADLSLEDFKYLNDDELKVSFVPDSEMKPQELVLNTPNQIVEMLHLASVYKGITVPSMLYDSTGTKKMAAIASYVIDALEKGRVLIVDELDNSLHFKLTRAIIAMFNNDLNAEAQLIVTVHDVSLLDCQTLFRKDQIWFSYKDDSNAYLYPLSEFTAEKDKIRSNSDLIDKYKRGVFGAIPEPDLYKSLLEVREDVQTSSN